MRSVPFSGTERFLWRNARRAVVQHGIAREVTKEEALARVDRAVELEE